MQEILEKYRKKQPENINNLIQQRHRKDMFIHGKHESKSLKAD